MKFIVLETGFTNSNTNQFTLTACLLSVVKNALQIKVLF